MLDFNQVPLPQDIFDGIIAHFHGDSQFLHTCALVCHSWLAEARSHIFHNITLDPPRHHRGGNPVFAFFNKPPASLCAKLLDVLEKSERGNLGPIAPYIRDLTICEGMIGREWIAHEPALLAVIHKLSNLRRFEITRIASVRIPWGELPAPLKMAVREQVLSSGLTELKLGSLQLDNVCDLEDMLGACRRLRVLEVNHLSFRDETMESLDANGNAIVTLPLDTLLIGPRTSIAFIGYLLHPLSTISVSDVRHLTLSISGNFPEFARLLHASSSVETLELVLMNDVDLKQYWEVPPSQHFDLVQVPTLRRLKAYCDVLQKGDDPLLWVSRLLYTGVDSIRPGRANAIENVWIVYSLYLPAPYMDRFLSIGVFDAWYDIDCILSGTTGGNDAMDAHAYSNLKDVKLDFMLENPIGFGIAPRFLKDIVLHSRGLRKKKMLTISASDTSG